MFSWKMLRPMMVAVVVLLFIVVKLVRRVRRKKEKPVETGAFFLPEPVQPQVPVQQPVQPAQAVEENGKALLKEFMRDVEFLNDFEYNLNYEINFNERSEPIVNKAYVSVSRIENDDKPKKSKGKK